MRPFAFLPVMLVVSLLLPMMSVAEIPPADELLQSRMRTPLLQGEGTMTGEGVCWHAAYDMGKFMQGYRKSGDEAYLRAAVTYYDALIEKMHTSPDGYRGWVGPYIYDDSVICDVHIGDAILINPMLDFSEIIHTHESEEIREQYLPDAERYVELAKTHLLEKWDTRGTWCEDGDFGAYVSWDQYLKSDTMDRFQELDVKNTTLSLPFNKQNSMGIASLRIYRITGDEAYRDKALKIFNFMKSRMALYENHHVWNYWEPFGPWDINNETEHTLRHWVNVHPYRDYQAGEIHEIVEAYHSGITFSSGDIRAIVNTNLKVMWNGEYENPQWNNSNHAVQMDALGELPIKEPPGGHFTRLAGTLWSGLSQFSETVQRLQGRSEIVPASFERKHSSLPVTEYIRPFNSNKMLSMVACIPAVAEPGTLLVCQKRVPGELLIELVSQDGREVLATLVERDSERAGVFIFPWQNGQTADVDPGTYRVRWTVQDEFRECWITIQ